MVRKVGMGTGWSQELGPWGCSDVGWGGVCGKVVVAYDHSLGKQG